jgi:hypothetical protein
MKMLILLSLFWTCIATAQTDTACAPSTQSCDFYLCAARALNCTRNDYPLRFGYPLCQRYLSDQNHSTENLRAWLPAVRQCLQEKFVALKVSSCQRLEEAAFDTHVQCYVETGFCRLNEADKTWLVWETSWQMVYPLALQTALQVERICRSQ